MTAGALARRVRLDNVEDVYPLTPVQAGMLFHTLLEPDVGMYVNQLDATLRGVLDTAALRAAWQAVIAARPGLRTAFVWEGLAQPLQVVRAHVDLPWTERVTRGGLELLEAERTRVLDPAVAPLMQFLLVREEEDMHRLVWTHHQMLLDGWSLGLVLEDVFTAYEQLRRGIAPALPPRPPFSDYIAWLQNHDRERDGAFWRRQLSGFAAPTPLPPAEGQCFTAATSRIGQAERILSAELTSDLAELARRTRVTQSTVLQGAWGLLLQRLCGTDDVVFGVAISGRPAELRDVERIIGLFINTLPVRVRTRRHDRLGPWLAALQRQVAEVQGMAHCALPDIRRWSNLPSRAPLFESILAFENYPFDAGLGRGRASVDIAALAGRSSTNYPLALVVAPGRRVGLRIEYSRSRFDEDTAARLLSRLETLLAGAVADPGQRLSRLPVMPAHERRRLLVDWNRTQRAFPRERPVHELVAEQARRAPAGAGGGHQRR